MMTEETNSIEWRYQRLMTAVRDCAERMCKPCRKILESATIETISTPSARKSIPKASQYNECRPDEHSSAASSKSESVPDSANEGPGKTATVEPTSQNVSESPFLSRSDNDEFAWSTPTRITEGTNTNLQPNRTLVDAEQEIISARKKRRRPSSEPGIPDDRLRRDIICIEILSDGSPVKMPLRVQTEMPDNHESKSQQQQLIGTSSTAKDHKPRLYEEVFRKQSDRSRLQGTTCPCCTEFRLAVDATRSEDERAAALQRTSRHRIIQQRSGDDPPGFWDLDFGPSQDDPA